VPAREVGAADVTDSTGADEVRKCGDGFFDWRNGIEAVELEEVNVVGAKPFQRAINGADKVKARGAKIVGGVTSGKGGFG